MDRELMQPVRGMRDFLPPEMRKRNKLFQIWSAVALQFGFEQYDASVVESLELLKRKAGEEITEQIYYFKDKSGRELALRPEMTPSLARMILLQGQTLAMPVKWYFIGQCFRYERMTTGRKREHYQLNLDVLGEKGQMAEVEVIAAAISVLKELGLGPSEVQVRVGSRRLLSGLLKAKGLSDSEIANAFLGIDKRGKMSDDQIASLLRESGISENKVKAIFSVLALDRLDSIGTGATGETESVEEMKSLFANAKAIGIEDFLTVDLSIVRGLSYYTGIVFECFDTERKFRAIFGGGRYDRLFEQMGGMSLPAVGLGFGDVVIAEVLKYYGKQISPERELDYVVAYTDMALADKAMALSQTLREKGATVSLLYGAQRMKKILKFGNQSGAKKVAILDPQETLGGQYLVKDLADSSQTMEAL